MNTVTLRVKLQIALAMLLVVGLGALAQMPGAGGPPGMSAAITKIFGDIKAFTAKAEVQVMDGSQKELVSMPMDFEFADGLIRVGLDLTKMKNSSAPPGVADQLKQMGMAQVVSIVRPDKNLVYVVYPDRKAVLSMPLPKDESDKNAKVERTPQGKETVDGHPCVKNKVVIPGAKDEKVEATTWNASDLNDFPIQIQTNEAGNTSFVRFKNVQFAKPDAKEFEPPAGYAQYKNPMELMQAVTSSMTPDQGEKK